MDDFSWRDMARATFAQCLPCLAVPSQDEGAGDANAAAANSGDARARLRAALSRNDELEGLLVDSEYSDGDALSLHSNIGRGTRGVRKKKRRSKKKPIRIFGYDLFGRSVALGEDEIDDESSALNPSVGRRQLDLSSSSLDSDPQPLTESRLAELSARFEPPASDTQLRREEEEQLLREERRAARRARRASRDAAMVLNMSGGDGYGYGPHSPYTPTPPMGTDEFGPFEVAAVSAPDGDDLPPLSPLTASHPRGPGYEEEEIDGIDFGAGPYVTRPKTGSNRSGSDTLSQTQHSDPPVYPHQLAYPHNVPLPASTASESFPQVELPRKKKRSKHSKSTASSNSVPSPTPMSPIGGPEEIRIREPVSPLDESGIKVVRDDFSLPFVKTPRNIQEL